MEKRLYRSKDERMVWGVCGGLARYFDIDPTIVRVIAVILALANGVGIIAYVILAIAVPTESSKASEPKDVVKENIEEIKQTTSELGDEIRSSFKANESSSSSTTEVQKNSRNIIGIILIIAGGVFLLTNFFSFWWFQWEYLWPLILVGIGVLIVVGVRRK